MRIVDEDLIKEVEKEMEEEELKELEEKMEIPEVEKERFLRIRTPEEIEFLSRKKFIELLDELNQKDLNLATYEEFFSKINTYIREIRLEMDETIQRFLEKKEQYDKQKKIISKYDTFGILAKHYALTDDLIYHLIKSIVELMRIAILLEIGVKKSYPTLHRIYSKGLRRDHIKKEIEEKITEQMAYLSTILDHAGINKEKVLTETIRLREEIQKGLIDDAVKSMKLKLITKMLQLYYVIERTNKEGREPSITFVSDIVKGRTETIHSAIANLIKLGYVEYKLKEGKQLRGGLRALKEPTRDELEEKIDEITLNLKLKDVISETRFPQNQMPSKNEKMSNSWENNNANDTNPEKEPENSLNENEENNNGGDG